MAVDADGARHAAPSAGRGRSGRTPIASLRLFVAVLLPDALRTRLADEVAGLRAVAADVAWVAPANLHLTLKFLGAVDEGQVPALEAALATAVTGHPPFDLACVGLGAFPSLARPRVVWAGVAAGAAETARLAGTVESALSPLGFPPEGRAFTAHVTLGRLRVPRRRPALEARLGAAATRALGAMRVEAVSLMRSELSPHGARYAQLAAFRLGPPRT